MEDFEHLTYGTMIIDKHHTKYEFRGIINGKDGKQLLLINNASERVTPCDYEIRWNGYKLCETKNTVAKPPLFPTEKVDDVTLGGLYKLKNPPTDCPLQIYRVINIFYTHGSPTEIALDKFGGRDFRVDKTHFLENYEELEVTVKTNN
jgi:hypothetical protein